MSKIDEVNSQKFECWAIVEIMGHVMLAGQVSEQNIAGAALLRVDVPATKNQEAYTKLYGMGSIYCITPCDEETAKSAADGLRQKPVDTWKLNLPQLQAPVRGYIGDDDDNGFVGDEEDDGDDHFAGEVSPDF